MTFKLAKARKSIGEFTSYTVSSAMAGIMFSRFGLGSVRPRQIFRIWLVAVRFEPNFENIKIPYPGFSGSWVGIEFRLPDILHLLIEVWRILLAVCRNTPDFANHTVWVAFRLMSVVVTPPAVLIPREGGATLRTSPESAQVTPASSGLMSLLDSLSSKRSKTS